LTTSFADDALGAVTTLSCDGTAGIAGDRLKLEPVEKMGFIINFAENTVSGFGDIVEVDWGIS